MDLTFFKNRADQLEADGDIIAAIQFESLNSANVQHSFASITGVAETVTNGSEDGTIELGTFRSGTYAVRATIQDDVTVNTGNLVIGTSGKGIDFSATSDASGMTSELLDDYEEGTWTVTMSDAAAAGNDSATTGSGYYTKVGNKVDVWGNVNNMSTVGMTAGNDMYIKGLPFTTSNTIPYIGSVSMNSVTQGDVDYKVVADANTTVARVYGGVSGGSADPLIVSEFTSGTADIFFHISYFV